ETISGTDERWAAIVPLRRAQLLVQEKQWQAARELAEGIEKQFPEFEQQYDADYLVGRCLAAQGEFDAARTRFQRVVQSPIGGKTETAAMAQWMIGETHFHQENFD